MTFVAFEGTQNGVGYAVDRCRRQVRRGSRGVALTRVSLYGSSPR